MTFPPQAAAPSISDALARLWARFLPEIENRLALVERAAATLQSGALSEDEREAAHQAAHKLAGVLGTFGLQRGTELAREAELLLEDASAFSSSSALGLAAWAAELRMVIDSRK